MIYSNIVKGIFLERPNRFIAKVIINGREETVHVKNTGRCKEILIKGVKVYLEYSNNPKRKTSYSLIAAEKGEKIINIDSQAPNKVVEDALIAGKIKGIIPSIVKREVTYNNSRFDLYFEYSDKKCFMEIKGVTLENNGLTMFPDAPTSRGKKHVEELITARKDGYVSYLLFLVQLTGVHSFSPNYKTDLDFSKSIVTAKENSVNLLVYDTLVTPNSILLNKEVPLLL